LGKNQNLTPTPAKVAKAAKDDNNFRNFRDFRSPPSVFDVQADDTLPAIEAEANRDRFEERAAIMEFDEGLPRAEAEALADRDTREAERDASPYASALTALRASCPAYVPEDRWRQAIVDAATFITEWGAQARARGWTAPELFGLHPVPEQPAANYDRLARVNDMGLVWLLRKRQVVALDATAVSMRCDNGILKFYRRTEPAAAKGATL
jgi:hypothetical protein